jgi:hypothetical protein
MLLLLLLLFLDPSPFCRWIDCITWVWPGGVWDPACGGGAGGGAGAVGGGGGGSGRPALFLGGGMEAGRSPFFVVPWCGA